MTPTVQYRPAQVNRAIFFQVASLIVPSVAFTIELFQTITEPSLFRFLVIGVMLSLGLIVFGVPIFLAARRHNWARIYLLAMFFVGLGLEFWYWDLVVKESWFSLFINFACTLAEVASLYWLFSGEGGTWFKNRSQR